MPFTAWMRTLWGDNSARMPERDEQVMIADAVMSELDQSMREYERYTRERDSEEKRRKFGVDYSWLISTRETPNVQIPQLERFELESLCQQILSGECGPVISSFRGHLAHEPPLMEFPRIMRACIVQALERRPRNESLGEWILKRRHSLGNIKLRQSSKVAPVMVEGDVEMQIKAGHVNTPGVDGREVTTVLYEQETSDTV